MIGRLRLDSLTIAPRICPNYAAPGQGKMTYVQHRGREYESRTDAWAGKSLDAKMKAIDARARWLEEQIRTRPEFSTRINGCRFCNSSEPAVQAWPAAFRCPCGEIYVLDRYFADDVERLYRVIA